MAPLVLIVDDNPFHIMATENILNPAGVKTITACSGDSAIELAKGYTQQNKKIHLVLMDIDMPEMSGLKTTREMRRLMSLDVIQKIPIVALTSKNTEEDKAKCFNVGMEEHMTKPFKESDIDRINDKYLSV